MTPDLAWYNMMRSRGVMFDAETVERMKQVQADWNIAYRAQLEAENDVTELAGGGLLIKAKRRSRWWRR